MPKFRLFTMIWLCLTLAVGPDLTRAAPASSVSAPVLKWHNGGCFASWCQTGWYASPAVADIDNDGQQEVIWGSYDVVSLNGATGALEWRAASGSRVWPGIAVADLTRNGSLEIVVGRNSNQLTVYNSNGTVAWTRNPFSGGEVRTLAVEDLETDGQLEIIAGRASGGSFQQLSVYEPDGSVRPGWPARRDGEPGYGWGMYNENVTVGDLDGDGYKEIIGPTDTHYITALDRNGNQLPTNAIYNGFSPAGPKVWSQVGVHVDHPVDLRGYANCGVEHRPNFANSAPAMADVNRDGTLEIIVPGDVYDCAVGDNEQGDLYIMPWILKLDRSRWSGGGYDWTAIPTPEPNSGPLSEDYNLIENNVQNAVVADLDGDGQKEILFPSYDGRVHAYWLDKTQHGNWPYDVPGSGIRFAGEPIVADLDNDGHAEVIFTSWPEKSGSRVGQLHILDYQGNPLHAVDLPSSFPGGSWNGGLGAPTIANIDGDSDKELVLGTSSSGVVAYDLPNTAGARILWGTGRGSFKRTGVAPSAGLVNADFDGDGRTDVAAHYAGLSQLWWRNSRSGAWEGVWIDPASPYTLVTNSDFDGDGKADVAAHYTTASQVSWRNSSTGAWSSAAIAASSPYSLVGHSDFDGDGRTDVAAYYPSLSQVWWRNSTTGAWEGVWIYPAPAYTLLTGSDFDGDGRTDVAAYYESLSQIWWRNSTTGTWEGVWIYPSPAYSLMTKGDYDGDGRPDIAAYYESLSQVWWRNSSSGTWEGVWIDPSSPYELVKDVDFDGDGQTDVAAYYAGPSQVWWRNSSTGAWSGTWIDPSSAYNLITGSE